MGTGLMGIAINAPTAVSAVKSAHSVSLFVFILFSFQRLDIILSISYDIYNIHVEINPFNY